MTSRPTTGSICERQTRSSRRSRPCATVLRAHATAYRDQPSWSGIQADRGSRENMAAHQRPRTDHAIAGRHCLQGRRTGARRSARSAETRRLTPLFINRSYTRLDRISPDPYSPVLPARCDASIGVVSDRPSAHSCDLSIGVASTHRGRCDSSFAARRRADGRKAEHSSLSTTAARTTAKAEVLESAAGLGSAS